MPDHTEITTRQYWEETCAEGIRMRLPSSLLVDTGNLGRLLRRGVRPGADVLEIGCAPGKTLAWAARRLGARVAGVDYSRPGTALAGRLFGALGIEADLRCEDVFETTFPPGRFDVVYSVGVIEHFADPRQIVRKHVTLLKPGGTALIAVPNFGGLYGRLQRWASPAMLRLHNLDIMNAPALEALAPADLSGQVSARPFGRMSLWLVSLAKRWPARLALAAQCAVNAAGLIQPLDIAPLCPMLVLSIVRKGQSSP